MCVSGVRDQVVRDPRVTDLNALGSACGAGGVDQIRSVVGRNIDIRSIITAEG